MTIERERYGAPVSVLCDSKRCNEYADTDCTDFSSALAKVKSRGWKVGKVGDEWTHTCPDCVKEQGQ